MKAGAVREEGGTTTETNLWSNEKTGGSHCKQAIQTFGKSYLVPDKWEGKGGEERRQITRREKEGRKSIVPPISALDLILQ